MKRVVESQSTDLSCYFKYYNFTLVGDRAGDVLFYRNNLLLGRIRPVENTVEVINDHMYERYGEDIVKAIEEYENEFGLLVTLIVKEFYL